MSESLDQLLQFARQCHIHTLSDQDKAECMELEKELEEKLNLENVDQICNLRICALKFNLYRRYSGLPSLKYNN